MIMRKFTADELIYFNEELLKYKSPWISKIVIKSWFKFGRYSIYPIFLIIFALGMIYNSLGVVWTPRHDIIWMIIKSLVFLFFGIGLLLLMAHLLQQQKIKKTQNQLGLSVDEWNYLVETFNIEV